MVSLVAVCLAQLQPVACLAVWAPALVVQPFGPIAYLALGRKAAPITELAS